MLSILTASVVVTFLQYSHRRVGLARLIGIVVFGSVALLAAYVPRRHTLAASCRDGESITFEFSEHGQNPAEHFRYFDYETTTVTVPISSVGVPAAAFLGLIPLSFEINSDRGRWPMPEMPPRRDVPPARPSIQPFVLFPEGESVGWLVLRIDQKLFSTIAAEPVRLAGSFAASVVLMGQAREVKVETYGFEIPTLGRCANFLVENTMSPYRNDMLKALCESPDEVPRARIELVHLPTGRRVRHSLGDAGTHMGYPTPTWLSPVHRRNTFFHITDNSLQGAGDQWRVTRSDIPDSKLVFTPLLDAGCSIVPINFGNIDLRRFVLKILRERYPR